MLCYENVHNRVTEILNRTRVIVQCVRRLPICLAYINSGSIPAAQMGPQVRVRSKTKANIPGVVPPQIEIKSLYYF